MVSKKQYIHYCWFGGKRLPKLAKKCIRSWRKYLPDFEIKCWDETNCDVNECPFVKQLYQQKKWAFVSDYFRTKALHEYGGIYLDTDMEIISSINDIIENNNSFLGIEDTGYIAVGVWYEKNPHSKLTSTLLKKYQSLKNIASSDLTDLSIPRLISDILKADNAKMASEKIQRLKNGTTIYPREYFYPLSYGHDLNHFTNNTRMIHHYSASWISTKEKIELYLVRKIGRKRTLLIQKTYSKIKRLAIILIKAFLFPVVLYRRSKSFKYKEIIRSEEYNTRIQNTILQIKKHNKPRLIIMNSDWLGTANATMEIFPDAIDSGELLRNQDIRAVRDAILSTKTNEVIFSAFALGWSSLAKALKRKKRNIKIKVYWHGSHSQITDRYGWERYKEILRLTNKGVITSIASCKKSLVNFYREIGSIKTVFLTNKVNIDTPKTKPYNKLSIGIYAAECTNWRKNVFTQIAAVSQIKDAVIDMAPLDPIAKQFANRLGIKISGVAKNISREELIKRMSKNTINLYVTFSECAPMLPLESLAVGVPCITGNNHHYFQDSKLEKYLVVNNECDTKEIKSKIKLCIKNKQKIANLYEEFNIKNSRELHENLQHFLEASNDRSKK